MGMENATIHPELRNQINFELLYYENMGVDWTKIESNSCHLITLLACKSLTESLGPSILELKVALTLIDFRENGDYNPEDFNRPSSLKIIVQCHLHILHTCRTYTSSIQHGVDVIVCLLYWAPHPLTKLIRMVHILVNWYTASKPCWTDCSSRRANSALLNILRLQSETKKQSINGYETWFNPRRS